MPPGRLRHGLAAVLLCIATVSSAVETFAVDVGRAAVGGAVVHGVRLSYGLGDGALTVNIDRLDLPGDQPPVRDVRIDCPAARLAPDRVTCADARLSASWAPVGTVAADAAATWRRDTGTLDVTLPSLPVGGSGLRVAAHYGPGGWRVNAQGNGLAPGAILALAGDAVRGWQAGGGTVSVNATFSGDAAGVLRTAGEIVLEGLSGGSASGLQAAEGVTGRLSWAARGGDGDWFGQTEAALDGGQVYSDPVFVDLAAHPLTLRTDLTVPETLDSVHLSRVRVDQPGLVSGQGTLTWASGRGIVAADVTPLTLSLPAAYATYARPFLTGGGFPEVAGDGNATLRAAFADGVLRSVNLRLSGVGLDGADYRLNGLDARLDWRAGDLDAPAASRLSVQGGSLHGVPVGAFDARALLHGDGGRLLAPLRVPIADGALAVERLALSGLAGDNPAAALDARVTPISLGPVTQALGWPRFGGTLSGELPTLRYANGTASVAGTLRIEAFKGLIRLQDLVLSDPFGVAPRLTGELTAQGLDLETLTTAFEFGRITGTLEGRVTGLRLVGWQPAAFDAWFHTPVDDPVPHRISQRAIEALSSIGGSGAAGALSRGLLSVFDAFGYARLGLGCRLSGDVCLMRGVGPAENGYYIVEGASVPRVDVIGHVDRVSWSTFIRQLAGVTAGGAPVVE
ncbi:hypothetical protein NYO91_09865 [Arhodomonas aquaeolei]|uniref:hypothetical protein n=1 Tax=Arhodomonas aquaeolei TaxID=2369 RepID=UPI0021692667|nr:hypothetical protein [Arhodomonas aquaeolei]MCS4504381.1 hypothetical protein [Arhodomonas aquaeolei]